MSIDFDNTVFTDGPLGTDGDRSGSLGVPRRGRRFGLAGEGAEDVEPQSEVGTAVSFGFAADTQRVVTVTIEDVWPSRFRARTDESLRGADS